MVFLICPWQAAPPMAVPKPPTRRTCASCLAAPLPGGRGRRRYCDACIAAFMDADPVCASCGKAYVRSGANLQCLGCGTVWTVRRAGERQRAERLVRVEFGPPRHDWMRRERAGVTPGTCHDCGAAFEVGDNHRSRSRLYCTACRGKRYNKAIAGVRWRAAVGRRSNARCIRMHSFECNTCGRRTEREFTTRRPRTCWECLGKRGAASRNRKSGIRRYAAAPPQEGRPRRRQGTARRRVRV